MNKYAAICRLVRFGKQADVPSGGPLPGGTGYEAKEQDKIQTVNGADILRKTPFGLSGVAYGTKGVNSGKRPAKLLRPDDITSL